VRVQKAGEILPALDLATYFFEKLLGEADPAKNGLKQAFEWR